MPASAPEPEPRSRRSRLIDVMQRDHQNGRLRPLEDYVREAPEERENLVSEYGALSDETLELPRPSRPGEAVSGRVDHFEITGLLGRGGQGAVYRARDLRFTDREVALKLLDRSAGFDDSRVARLQREADLAARLNHPGICPIHEVAVRDEVAYIAMDLVAGESLATLLRRARGRRRGAGILAPLKLADPSRRKLPPDDAESLPWNREELREVARLVRDLADAVAHAHAARIIHRDLKPGNVIVRPDGRPVVLDFGLARGDAQELATLTRSGEFFGTPAYMSPEQIEGPPSALDARCDVWAIGILLRELVAFARPFQGHNVEGLLRRITLDPLPDPTKTCPAVDRHLAAIIEAATERRLDRRYADAGALRDDLGRWLEGRPIAARRPGVLDRGRAWIGRNPSLSVALGAVVLSLTAGLVVSLLLLQRARGSEADAIEEKAQADAAKYRAREDAARAKQAEGLAETRRLEAVRAETSAIQGQLRLAWSRGAWNETLVIGDALEEREDIDRVGLDLMRLDALYGLGREADARELLDDLANRPDLGDHTARVLLLRGDLFADRFADPESGVGELEEALELVASGAGNLTNADRLYIEATLAPSLLEAKAALSRALQDEPRHRAALEQLVNVQLALMDFEGMARTALRVRALYPQDEDAHRFYAFYEALSADAETADAALQDLLENGAPRFGASVMALLTLGMKVLPEVDAVLMNYTFRGSLRVVPDFGRLIEKRPLLKPFLAQRGLGFDSLDRTPGPRPLRIPRSLARALGDAQRLSLAATKILIPSKKRVGKLVGELEAVVARAPLPELRWLLASLRLKADQWKRAAAEMQALARDVPRFLPRSVATWNTAVWAQLEKRNPDPAQRERLFEAAITVLAVDTWTPPDLARLAQRFVDAHATVLSRLFVDRLRKLDPEHPEIRLYEGIADAVDEKWLSAVRNLEAVLSRGEPKRHLKQARRWLKTAQEGLRKAEVGK